RIGLAGLLSLLIAVWTGVSAGVRAQEATEGWPMLGRDPGHSATAEGPSPPYRVGWSGSVGLGGPVAGPVAAGGVVVVVTRSGVSALDPATGDVTWSADRTPGPAGEAAVSGDTVVHASGSGSTGAVVARGLGDGRERWRAFTGSAVPGAVMIEGDVVYVGTSDGALLGFDVSTGEERFRFQAEGAIHSPPAVSGGVVLAAWEERGEGRATIRALEIDSEESERSPAWQVSSRPGSLPSGVVSADEDTVLVGAGDGSFRALGLSVGDQRWVTGLRDAVAGGQVPAAGPALVAADRLHVSRLDPSTGEEEWSFRLADFRALGDDRVNTLSASSPVVSSDAVIAGDATGLASAIDVETGHRVWRADLGPGAVGPAAVDGDRIYLTTLGSDGLVVALEHDPQGPRLEEVSDTVLSPLRALFDFLVAFVAVSIVILGLFRYALGRRPPASTEDRT
ncbi:MAG TPA: PQQ-binding-like beta-propeller repeat protein, partial [Actinomycetota bacterium]|nr:PQQ-binding-like beta-propeller repeat protein [Actinomycetota bacterium]